MKLRWSPIRTAALSDLRRRKLQSLIIAFVMLLASGAATMALSLLVETDAPYEHAFAHANGAHLAITYDARHVSTERLQATASAHGVTASAGPWDEVMADLSAPGKGAGFGSAMRATIVGRGSPNTSVDRLTVESGRWARTTRELVASQALTDSFGLAVGDPLTLSGHAFRVVGIAASISPLTDAWVLPSQLPPLVSRGSPLQYQMLYRVRPSSSSADLRHATQSIAGHLSPSAVITTSNYLDVKRNADLTSAVMVPFLLAFSAFALLAAVFIIANVVSGIVIAGYRDFGIMKSIGFTPGQVILVLLVQILAPVLLGCLAGIPLGTLASQPFLQQTAHALGLPSPFTAALPVDLLVLAGVLAAATISALVPGWRAGRMSAVSSITTGSAPSTGRASGLSAKLSNLPLPRPVSLGIGDAVTRPLRSLTTLGAIVIGVSTVVFALNLHLSLGQVAAHLIRDRYVQVTVNRPSPDQLGGGKLGPSAGQPRPPSDPQVSHLIQSNPGTARFVAEATTQVRVPGIAEPIHYYAYRGSSSWIGYAMISGRWFSGRGEVVAPTKLIQQAHLHVGQFFTARMHGSPVRLHLVGEILDQRDGDLLLRGGWNIPASLMPLQATDYEIQVKPGVDPQAYRSSLSTASSGNGPNFLNINTVQQSSTDTTFILFNSVIAGLALVLTAIAVAGVFNTVVLTTREKVHDVAVLKAIGMAPAQVVVMVIAGVAFLGLIAGAVGIPVGYKLHREIIQFMGQIATGTAIPPAFFDLIDHGFLVVLALGGVAIAALGAWLPAQWAASSKVAEVLQSE